MTDYTKNYPSTGWQTGEAGATPITADNLNHIEDGLDAAHSEIDTNNSAQTAALTAHKASTDHDAHMDARYVPIATIFVPAGAVSMFAGTAAPAGWLEMNGAILAQAGTYAALYAAIGTRYNLGNEGAGNFRIPDARGYFPRFVNTAGSGEDANRTLGSKQDDGVGPHNHTVSMQTPSPNYTGGSPNKPWVPGGSQQTSNGADGTVPTIGETRPVNIAFMGIIKY